MFELFTQMMYALQHSTPEEFEQARKKLGDACKKVDEAMSPPNTGSSGLSLAACKFRCIGVGEFGEERIYCHWESR